jgi:uncharacterized protein DUF4307
MTVSTPPPGRYGRPRNRTGAVAVAVVLLTVLVAWVVWATLRARAPDASGQVTGFRVRGAHSLQVSLAVGGDPGRITCTVQALDADRAVVGVTTARAEVGSSGRGETTVVVRTRATAVTAVVDGCSRLAD